jgi:ABC-type uncharacterized transport system permease subunit
MIIGTSILAIILYVLAAFKLGNRFLHNNEPSNQSLKTQAFVLGFIALVLHGIVLFESVQIQSGLNLGFYNALSLMGWGISFIVLLMALGKPLELLVLDLRSYFPAAEYFPIQRPWDYEYMYCYPFFPIAC